MKNSIIVWLGCLLLSASLCAQKPDSAYTREWRKADSLLNMAGLPKSALQVVNGIYADATRKKNSIQATKAILYRISIENNTGDKSINQQIALLQNQLRATTTVAEKSLVQLLLARQYMDYYNRMRYRLYNRSTTTNFVKTDIDTWAQPDFYNTLRALYDSALAPAPALQQTSIGSLAALIVPGNTRQLRPTLFDLAVNEAIQFYTTFDNAVPLPGTPDTAWLAPLPAFLQYHITTADSSGKTTIARLYQSLLRFHAHDIDPAALINADIDRITWASSSMNNVAGEKEIYNRALTALTELYPHASATLQAWYLLIEPLTRESYTPVTDTANRYNLVKAKALAEQHILPADTVTEGNYNLKLLVQQITHRELNTQTAQTNVPGIPSLMQVSYKNTDTLFVRIIRVNNTVKNTDNGVFDWKGFASMQAIAYTQPLPATGDYRTHTTEVKIPALQPGRYLLFTSNHASFNNGKDLLCAQFFAVSHISYIQNQNDYFLLNRETGEALPGVTANIYTTAWNARTRDYTYTKIASSKSDAHGLFQLNDNMAPGQANYALSFISGADTLNSNNIYRVYTNKTTAINPDETDAANAYFFTDRSIYRPGQTVYYKGLVITTDSSNGHPIVYRTKDSVHVYLKDANGTSIDSAAFWINSFGSFAGRFTLPAATLNGEFHLETGKIPGDGSFRVEEYKRPTFYIDFDTLSAAYRLQDSIHITGRVKAYAGYALPGAKVNFTVNRSAHFPYGWLFYRSRQPWSPVVQVAVDSIVTDANGRFALTFMAKPDNNISKASEPVFQFTADATVTDNNGETRTGSQTVSVSYHPIVLQVDAPERQRTDSFTAISISSRNLAGKNIPALVQVSISPLQEPQRLTRKRLWQQPDQFVIDSASFVQDFPYDPYKEQEDIHTWPQLPAVIRDTFTTSRNSFPVLHVLKPGYYAITITTVSAGDTIKNLAYVQLYEPGNKRLPNKTYNWSSSYTATQPNGKTANVLIGSSAPGIHLITHIQQQGKPALYQYKELGNGIDSISWPLQTGTGIYYAFVKHNRFYTAGTNFAITDTGKNIAIHYQSFRNKTAPGSREQWSIRVSGSNGSQTAAELLTGMYDASLDQFAPHSWTLPGLEQTTTFNNNWNAGRVFSAGYGTGNYLPEQPVPYLYPVYDRLLEPDVTSLLDRLPRPSAPMVMSRINTGFKAGMVAAQANEVAIRGSGTVSDSQQVVYVVDGVVTSALPSLKPADISSVTTLKGEEATALYGEKAANGVIVIVTKAGQQQQQPAQLRTNFNETAFFFPQLNADTAGNYTFSFTMPDAVTQWKWMSLAHNKQLAFGYREQMVTTQKTLMVQPNLPRFVRNGDQLEFSAKITNLSDKELSGQATLQLIDPTTNQPVDGLFQNVFPTQYFTAAASQSGNVKFPVSIPYNYNQPVTIRITAQAGNYSDGEEHALAVLSNRTLVTESMPLLVKGNTTQQFSFDKLLHNESETRTQQGITVEFSSNPLWYAIQALPYLMEYPHECAEQTFNRLYANLLAANIVTQHPAIKALFNQWQQDSTALLSNLQKNTELKQLVLQETPWVLDAANETQQRKNLALLFDIARMQQGTGKALQQLQQMQLPSGAFPWFNQGNEDIYITNYIVTGIGKLKSLHVLTPAVETQLTAIARNAISLLDSRMLVQYKKQNTAAGKIYLPYVSELQYLYMRSQFSTIPFADKAAFNYYYSKAKQQWTKQNNYNKALIALTALRNNDKAFALNQVIPSILENAVNDSSKGMYWKERTTCFWYASPIEHQSLLLLLMQEANKTAPAARLANAIAQMQTWLLLNKQTNNWRTTTATADACYVLLNDQQVSTANPTVQLQLGSEQFSSNSGEGYLKESIPAQKVNAAMGNIRVTVNGNAGKPAWGAVYWQYFEDNDKISNAASPLAVTRKLFVEKPGSNGPVLVPVNEGDELQVGSKVKVRMEIRSDRDLEYVHLKDSRGATLEPQNVLSGYQYQDGLGYYETTHDASTDFFFSYLHKGTYVFEYPAFVTHSGSFTAGIATIQCMYAPEFNAHSDGLKINVAEK